MTASASLLPGAEAAPAVPPAVGAEAELPAEPVATAVSYVDDSRLPTAEIALLIDPVWYEAKDLDLYPQPLAPVRPVYPPSAPDIAGDVTLLAQIDEFGTVQGLSVVRAEPVGYFEEAALRAFERARFEPAQREGRPVRSRILIKVRFAPEQKKASEG